MSSVNMDNIIFPFHFLYHLFLFLVLFHWHSCYIPDLMDQTFTISSSVVFVVCFKNIPFIKLRKFLSLPNFTEL